MILNLVFVASNRYKIEIGCIIHTLSLSSNTHREHVPLDVVRRDARGDHDDDEEEEGPAEQLEQRPEHPRHHRVADLELQKYCNRKSQAIFFLFLSEG